MPPPPRAPGRSPRIARVLLSVSMHACLLRMDRDPHLVIVIAISVRYGHRAAGSASRALRPCALQPLGVKTSLGAAGFDG